MEWIEKHQAFISLAIIVMGFLVQALHVRWKVGVLLKWQSEVEVKLKSIDTEINQIKITSARDGMRLDTLGADLTHMRSRLDDVHEMLIIALSGGRIGDRFKDS